jgi:hypothetical protein
MIEDGDPGEPGLRVSSVSFEVAPTAEQVEYMLRRLALLSDVPAELLDRARERWARNRDPKSFLPWLNETLSALEAPETVACDCGEELVDVARWRGRAVVRCEVCGTRWGVEVESPERYAYWLLDISQ